MQGDQSQGGEDDACLADLAPDEVTRSKDILQSYLRGDVDGHDEDGGEEISDGKVKDEQMCRLLQEPFPEYTYNDEEIPGECNQKEQDCHTGYTWSAVLERLKDHPFIMTHRVLAQVWTEAAKSQWTGSVVREVVHLPAPGATVHAWQNNMVKVALHSCRLSVPELVSIARQTPE